MRWFSMGMAVALLGACPGSVVPPAPEAGLPAWRAASRVVVPGGLVDVAGGSFHLSREDLEIDTRVAPLALALHWDSAGRSWRFHHQMHYAGDAFTDASGASFDLGAVPFDAPIPGSVWDRVDADTLRTRGGLVHDFDARGRLAVVRWRADPWPRLRYEWAADADRLERVLQCTAANACETVFELEHDLLGRPVRVRDRAGRTSEYAWDAAGRLLSARDALDIARAWAGTRYEYAGDLVSAVTTSELERIELSYAGGRLTELVQVGAEHPVWRFAYPRKPKSELLFTTRRTDPLGHVTHDHWDASRRLVQRVSPSGELTHHGWEGLRPVSETRPDGTTTRWIWQGDELVETILASGNRVRVAYAAAGEWRERPFARAVASASDDLGEIEARGYDAAGRLVSVTNGAGETLRFTWAGGLLRTVRDAAGNTTTLSQYGADGHPRRVEDATGVRTRVYDAVGNLVSTDALTPGTAPGAPGVVEVAYDEDRNPQRVTLAEDGAAETRTLVVTHRSDGRWQRIDRPYGGASEREFDGLGRVVAERERVDGEWRETRLEVDALGRVISRERPNGMREHVSFDPEGRVAGRAIVENGAVQSAVAFTRVGGRVTRIFDTIHGAAETITYDDAGRPVARHYPDGGRKQVGFDLRSRPVTSFWIDEARGFSYGVAIGYDAAGRRVALGDAGGALVAHRFAAGRLVETRTGNGLVRRFRYDAETGLASGSETRRGASVRASTTIDRGSICLHTLPLCRTELTTTASVVSDTTAETHLVGGSPEYPVPEGGVRASETITAVASDDTWRRRVRAYDALGGILWELDQGQGGCLGRAFDYNAERNRLLAVRSDCTSAELHRYVYDEAGFVVERDGVALDWDGAGRIVRVGDEARFVWDTLGRPVSRTIDGVTTRLRFGGEVEADASGAPVALDLPAVRVDFGSATRRYRHADLRGNPKLVSDGAGRIVSQYVYGATRLERVLGDDGDGGRRFAQGVQVGDLVLLGHRLLDGDAAWFLAPDPVFEWRSQHAYAYGNPIHFWDPDGRLGVRAAGWVLGIGGTLGGAAFGVAFGPWFAPAGYLLGTAAANLALQAIDPAGPRLTFQGAIQSVLPYTAPDAGGGGLGGGGVFSPGGAIHAPSRDAIPPSLPPPPPTVEKEVEIEVESFSSLGSLVSIGFMVALSFGGFGF